MTCQQRVSNLPKEISVSSFLTAINLQAGNVGDENGDFCTQIYIFMLTQPFS